MIQLEKYDPVACQKRVNDFAGAEKANLAKDYSHLQEQGRKNLEARYPEKPSYSRDIYRDSLAYWGVHFQEDNEQDIPEFAEAP